MYIRDLMFLTEDGTPSEKVRMLQHQLGERRKLA